MNFNNKIKIILFIVTFLSSVLVAFSQQDNTLYYLGNTPQATISNPSVIDNHKIWIGGLAVPILGQLPPTMYMNLGSTGFSANQLIRLGTGAYADSLIFDVDNLLNELNDINYITSEINLNWLSGGFHIQDYYITLSITDKIEAQLGFPKDLIGIMWNGNTAYIDKPADFNGLNVSATHYREYAIGAAKELNNKISVGAKIKFLFGKTNIQTKKADITLQTAPDLSFLKLHSDIEINSSLPSFVNIDYDGDSLGIGMTDIDAKAISDYFLNGKNMGLGLDFGATYNLNDKISFSGSVIDLGFIRWNSNNYKFTSKGDYEFKGADMTMVINEQDTISTYVERVTDSLINIFKPEMLNDSYITGLYTKMYLGGTYKFHEKIVVGLLTRTEIYQKKLHASVTLSANSNLTKWFSTSLSYSIINGSYANLGIGIGVNLAFMNFYFITDNMFSLQREVSTGIPLPYKSRNTNFRFGWNLTFGDIDKQSGNSKL